MAKRKTSRTVRHRGLLDHPLRRVVSWRVTTGTLTDPSRAVLRLECGHAVGAPPNRRDYKFARCEECPRKDVDEPLIDLID